MVTQESLKSITTRADSAMNQSRLEVLSYVFTSEAREKT